MAMETKYNLRSPGVKRLMREAMELANPTEEYYASPLEENLFEWHFTVRGPPGTEFEGGFYHGRILLPSQYPMQPPNIILLTPNGRFEINKKICLSISGHHPESWQPSWSIRTALLALIAFMPTAAAGTIGSLDYTAEERQQLARKSKNWECPSCGKISEKLLQGENVKKPELTQEESSLIQNIALKAEEEANRKDVKAPANDLEEHSSVQGLPETETDVRQRLSAARVFTEHDVNNIESQAVNNILAETLESGHKDQFWTIIMFIILAVIVILIIRRLFFI